MFAIDEKTGGAKHPSLSSTPTQFAEGWMLDDRKPPEGRYLSEISKLDHGRLSLRWHSGIGRWCMYRLVRGGCIPSEAKHQLQFVLSGVNGEYREPGMWLLTLLAECDTSQGGSLSPREAAIRKFKEMEERQKREDAESDRRLDAIASSFGDEVADYAVRNPVSVVVPGKSGDEQ